MSSIPADYPSLGSFGNIESVGFTLLPPPDTPGIVGTMLDAKVQSGSYVYDYTIEQAGTTRHLRTVYALVSKEGTTTQKLVTLTAQCLESRYDEVKPVLKAVTDSYKGA